MSGTGVEGSGSTRRVRRCLGLAFLFAAVCGAGLVASWSPAVAHQSGPTPDKPTIKGWSSNCTSISAGWSRPAKGTAGTNLDDVHLEAYEFAWRVQGTSSWTTLGQKDTISPNGTLIFVGESVSSVDTGSSYETVSSTITAGTTYELRGRLSRQEKDDASSDDWSPWSDAVTATPALKTNALAPTVSGVELNTDLDYPRLKVSFTSNTGTCYPNATGFEAKAEWNFYDVNDVIPDPPGVSDPANKYHMYDLGRPLSTTATTSSASATSMFISRDQGTITYAPSTEEQARCPDWDDMDFVTDYWHREIKNQVIDRQLSMGTYHLNTQFFCLYASENYTGMNYRSVPVNTTCSDPNNPGSMIPCTVTNTTLVQGNPSRYWVSMRSLVGTAGGYWTEAKQFDVPPDPWDHW